MARNVHSHPGCRVDDDFLPTRALKIVMVIIIEATANPLDLDQHRDSNNGQVCRAIREHHLCRFKCWPYRVAINVDRKVPNPLARLFRRFPVKFGRRGISLDRPAPKQLESWDLREIERVLQFHAALGDDELSVMTYTEIAHRVRNKSQRPY